MSLQYYHDLASDDDDIRFRAAYGLLSELAAENNPSGESLRYAVKRLIRGLASGRGSSRIGFSISLTETCADISNKLLSQLLGPNRSKGKEVEIDFDTIIDILQSSTVPVGKVSGQEERDHYLGRLFGLKAIVASGILFERESNVQQWTTVVDLLLEIAQKKPWLREECGFVIYSALHKCPEDQTRLAIQRLAAHGLVKSPEGVAICLRALDKFGASILPESTWPHQDPMHSSNHALLAKIMKETTLQKEQEAEGPDVIHDRGSWKSKLHFAWDDVLSKSIEMATSSKPSKIASSDSKFRFQTFWNTMVDENLFSASASEERKYWGFLVVGNAISRIPRPLVRFIFSRNFMRCFINQLAQSDRYLHLAAQKLLKVILDIAQADGSSMSPVEAIKALTSENGSACFDQLTKSKAVEKLLAVCNEDQLLVILGHFREILCSPATEDVSGAEKIRQHIADQMVAVLRHGKAAKSTMCINEIMSMQIGFGYFTTKFVYKANQIDRPPFSASSHAIFRTRLTSTLTLLMSNKDTMAEPWPYNAANDIQSTVEDGHVLVMELDEHVREALSSAMKTIKHINKRISKSKKNKTAHLQAFRLISSIAVLMLYNGDPDALSLLEELQICYDKLMDDKTERDDDADPMVIMTEIFLSFGSKSSKLLRKVAEQVFVVFSADMNLDALRTLLDVLGTKESIAGQQEMFNAEDDDDDDGEDEDESTSDIEILEADSDVEEVSESGDESEVDSEAEKEDTAAVNGTNAEAQAGLDEALAKALGTRRGDEDLGQSDSSSDGSDMDDDQMMAVDSHLVKIFKEKQKLAGKKQEKKDAKANVINLKRRVLDLLKIYLKQQHTNPLSLETILPLLTLIRSTSDKGLSQKTCDVVREYAKACKGQEVPAITDANKGFTLLEAIHTEAIREASHAQANACNSMSILVVKTLVAVDRDNVDGIVDLYGKTWKQWLLQKRCRVQASFFSSFINWSTSASKQLQE